MERIYHTWDKWECYANGFFDNHPPIGMTKSEAINKFGVFLKDIDQFEIAIKKVFEEWKYSCEHNLTNENMNRIAWIGQASVCITLHIPSIFCAGFNILTQEEQKVANDLALKYLNIWLEQKRFSKTDGKNKHKGGDQY